jgi:uncharacterized protein
VTGVRVAAAAVALLLSAGTATACDGTPDARLDRLVIASGASGDVYFALGQALAEAARDRVSGDVRVAETNGSIDNLRMVAEGRADVGFATVDVAELATQGDPPFSAALPIVALARVYDDYLQIVIRAESEIEQVSDLSGLAVSTGATDSGTEVVADRVLEASGHDITRVRASHLPPAESAQALRSGEIDAFFVTGGLPMPAVQQLADQRAIRLVTLLDEIEDLQAQHGERYQARTIPFGTYGMEDEVETLGVANVLVVRRGLPDQTAYQLTELLFAAKESLVNAHPEARRLDRRSALATVPVQLHPGAASYYRDQKIMALTPVAG